MAGVNPAGILPARVMGFDAGARRIGVACGSRLTGTAQALAVVARRDGEIDWPALDRMVREWRPDACVVGLPLALDGAEQAASALARKLASQLGTRYSLPVLLEDERHSSREAAARFAMQRRAGLSRRHDANALDSLAAVIIVERYFSGSAASASPITDGASAAPEVPNKDC